VGEPISPGERVRRTSRCPRDPDLHVAERGGDAAVLLLELIAKATNSSSGQPVVKVCVDEAT
jgi:hypothetical protein